MKSAALLSFDKKIITVTSYADNLPNITRPVDTLLAKTNIVSDSLVSGGF